MKDYEKLAKSPLKENRREAIICPDCPPDGAVGPAEEFPDLFLANPMLEFAYLEKPDLIESLSTMALSQLVGHPACPAYFIDWVIKHGSRLAHAVLLKNYQLTANELEVIAEANSGRPSEEARRRLMMGESFEQRQRNVRGDSLRFKGRCGNLHH